MNVFLSKSQCCYIFNFTVFDHVLIFHSISFLSFSPFEKRTHVIFYTLFFKNIRIFPFRFPFSLFCFSSLLYFIYFMYLVPIFPYISIFLSVNFSCFSVNQKPILVIFYALFFKNIYFCLLYFPFSPFYIFIPLYLYIFVIIYPFCPHILIFIFIIFAMFLDCIENHSLSFFTFYFLKIFIFISHCIFFFPHFTMFRIAVFLCLITYIVPYFYPLFDFYLHQYFMFFRMNQKPFFVIFHA